MPKQSSKPAGNPAGNPAPVAYSFTRFSTPEQAEGDSLRRQTAATVEWCERNGVHLDKSLTLHHVGSAFRGKHRSDTSTLGEFLKLAHRGRIAKGSYLIIENLDRLSREEEMHALELWLSILRAGITIVQLKPEVIFQHDKIGLNDVIRAILELSRGHSESAAKSDRLSAVWSERKRKAREEGKIATLALPGWVEDRGGRLAVSAQNKNTLRQIFRLAARGYGAVRIVRKLKDDRRPPFGRSGRWTVAYLTKILSDRRLLGEYQPIMKATGEPDGDPIPNYFPAVLTETEFYAVHRKVSVRKSTRKDIAAVDVQRVAELHQEGMTVAEIARELDASRQQVYRALVKLGEWETPAKPTPKKLYLFAGMVHKLWGNRPYRLKSDPVAGRSGKTLALEDRSMSFPYYVFERAILSQLAEIDPREILDGVNGHDDLMDKESELGGIEERIAELEGELLTGDVKAIGRVLRQLEARQDDLARQIAAAKQKAANPLSASWGEAKSLLTALDTAKDEDTAIRLRAVLRRIIANIGMAVIKIGRARQAYVEIEFTGQHAGRFRFYYVWYQPRTGNRSYKRPGGWNVASCAGEGPPIRREPGGERGRDGDGGSETIFTPSDWIKNPPSEPPDFLFPLPD